VEPILAGHDPSAVKVFCYSGVGLADEATRRLQSYSVHWRDVAGASDAALVEQIRSDGIDVLVDLSGHTAGNRLGVFARRAAPVQMTYLGYPDTTALAEMDYRISDRWADPVGLTERWHTEKLLRLQRVAWCYRPALDTPEIQARGETEVMFGSFNMLAKLSPQTVAAWARILRELPTARLILKSNGLADAPTRELAAARFAGAGVEARRLEMVGSDRELADHLRRYGQVDIALDPFPYNGTTTTCEALWMGGPLSA
jgi:predicted O-linked N-acetylglucosamine transferase (SPINDLY family)